MKALVALLAVVVLLAAGLLLADRWAESYADHLVAEQLAEQLHLSRQPHVDIEGFPFLTQWVSGDYQQIDVGISSFRADSITVRDIAAVVRGIRARPLITATSQGNLGVAASVRLSGLIPLSSLPLPAGVTVKAEGSRLQVFGSLFIFGLRIPISATERLALHGSTVTLTPTNVQARGTALHFNLSGQAAKKLAFSLRVPTLPFSTHVTGLTVRGSGVHLTAAGENVPLSP